MVVVFNYVNDLGKVQGFYPTITPVDLLDILPNELRHLYKIQNDSFEGCRTKNLIPRRIVLNFSVTNSQQIIEVPITPTISQLKETKQNSSATFVELIGEKINYTKLRYLLN